MTDKFKYRAFLTYAHEDGEHAQKLRKALENFRVPSSLVGKETEFGPVPARLFPIFRDRDELAGSAELGEAIQKALKEIAKHCTTIVIAHRLSTIKNSKSNFLWR